MKKHRRSTRLEIVKAAEPSAPRGVQYREYGKTGLKHMGGRVQEEWLSELSGINGVKVYKEMADNDPTIGAILYAMEMLMRQAEWRIEPASENSKDKESAEFIETCMDDMSQTWPDTISEILSMLPFGWSYHETVYKLRQGDSRDPSKRSKHTDGRIGWRKLPIRAQETLYEWIFDPADGGIQGMKQQAPPVFTIAEIPIQKALLFRTKTTKGNPEGRSILRNAYRPWFFKRRIEEIESIGIERDLAGLPVLTPPEKLNIWDQNPTSQQLLATAETLVQNIRRDAAEGVVKPFGWELALLSSGGRRQFDTNAVITRYDQRIAMTVLADFILLGHEKVGSFALSSSKTHLFSVAIGAYLDSIAEVFNRFAIPRLIQLNPDLPQENLPRLVHGDVETPDLKELGAFIKDMTGVGILIPDQALETYVREAAGLPEKVEEDMPREPRRATKDDQDDEDEGGEE